MYRVLTGTAKGLVVYPFSEDGIPGKPEIHFEGFSVTMTYMDPRNGRWWAGLSHKHWGQKLHYSDDNGLTWHETRPPSYKDVVDKHGVIPKLKQIWSMAHGGEDKPGELWLATEPAALFHSKDNGATFELLEPLWNLPGRHESDQWFGAGKDDPFIHSVVVDPSDSDRILIAVSCAGIFETKDQGNTWEPRNKGLVAAYLPNPHVEVGHDPHTLYMSSVNRDILWQQNHCGIFISKNGGAEWKDVSVHDGIPNYGFAMTVDEDNPSRAWVIPVESDEQRVAPGLKLEVYKTEDFGGNWIRDSEGLPAGLSFDIVLRHSFMKCKDLFVFGTTNGNLYYRNGDASSWVLITSHLTKINCLHAYND